MIQVVSLGAERDKRPEFLRLDLRFAMLLLSCDVKLRGLHPRVGLF
jgi:hypothetical protein